MSDEGMYYSGDGTENVNEWGDNDDLQALMHAAADADARDTEEALLKDDYTTEEPSVLPKNTTHSGKLLKTSSDEVSEKQSTVENESKQKFSGCFKTKTENLPDEVRAGLKPKHESETKAEHLPVEVRAGLKRKHEVGTKAENLPVEVRAGLKRKLEAGTKNKVKDKNLVTSTKSEGHANIVAAHYNTLEDKGLDERLKSRIYYMRNFNNWIKSMLINEYLNKVKEGMRHNSPVRVMDMCCGKGGDLLKWRKGNISYLICTDIASVSLEQCESRFNDMLSRSHRERNAGRIFKAEFISADCTKVRLRERYIDPSIKLDLVSCQFAFHYSFESLPQAECMLRNAAECLQPGGYFIGTIPDANVILARLRKAKSSSFGNDVYQITFQSDTTLPPLFGGKYNFHLDGVVDCPEFLVHFPTFVKLARKFGLQLVQMERFGDFYDRMSTEGYSLLQKMQSLETYPPFQGNTLLGTSKDDYTHASEFLNYDEDRKIGTLSKSEWEAAALYLTFAFQKVKTTWDANGKPQYEFI